MQIRGIYIHTAKNDLIAALDDRLGWTRVTENDATKDWNLSDNVGAFLDNMVERGY